MDSTFQINHNNKKQGSTQNSNLKTQNWAAKQTIRYATLADVEAICRVHAATWQEAYRGLLPRDYLAGVSYERWLPMFTQTISKGLHDVAVFPHEGGVNGVGGCITYGPAREEELSGWAEITAIYVLPQLWRQGLGGPLMRFALEGLRQKNYQDCYLWVLKGNQRACAFYEKMGFTASGREKIFEHEGQSLWELFYSIHL